MDWVEYNRKKKLQFRFRRDVGESVKVLPARLLEAAKAALKKPVPEIENKFAPEKREIKPITRQTYVTINPEHKGPKHASIRNEETNLETLRSKIERVTN